jgi:hypothetical protein
MDERVRELEHRVEALETRLERLIRLVGVSGGIVRGGVDDMLSEEKQSASAPADLEAGL